MTVTDVSGVGKAAVFLIRGEANVLFEAGMAYAADSMIESVKNELKGGKVDAVLLSHSHYDHVAGLPAVRRAWPDATVYGSARAQEVLRKPSALSAIRNLSGAAARASGLPWDYAYRDEDLRVDEALEDGETVWISDHKVLAFETLGHTRCSMSYIVDDDLMLCSESVGVLGQSGGYMPAFLVDYLGAMESIKNSEKFSVKQIILNHYGLVKEEDRAHIWDILTEKLVSSKKKMTDIMKRFESEEEALRELEHIFHSKVDKKEQPDEAFNMNAISMMKTLRRQFPEEFK